MGLPLRALPCLMLFLATFAGYATRVNVNIAILGMTDGAEDVCKERSATGR